VGEIINQIRSRLELLIILVSRKLEVNKNGRVLATLSTLQELSRLPLN
jgi:hypothetical protein